MSIMPIAALAAETTVEGDNSTDKPVFHHGTPEQTVWRKTMGAIETLSTGSGSEREAVHDSASGIHLAVLSTLGVDLPETAEILDFGLVPAAL